MFCGLGDNNGQHASQARHCRQVNAGKPGAYDKGHDHGADQAGRRPHAHAQDHLIGILHIRHIRGKPGHKPRCAEFVNIGKTECLDILIHCLSQVPRKTRGGPGAKLTSQYTQNQTGQGRQQHQPTDKIDMFHIARRHAIVDNGCHEQRNDGFHNNLSDHENRGQNRISFKFLNLSS